MQKQIQRTLSLILLIAVLLAVFTPAFAASKVETVISEARSHLGVRYRSPCSAPKNFDCSGFTRYCFSKVGVTLSPSAKAQGYNDDFRHIESISALRRGDVVLFNTNSHDGDLCDHTGIYLGGGKFIHASSAKGEVVISTLNEGFYNRTFSWGLRIL